MRRLSASVAIASGSSLLLELALTRLLSVTTWYHFAFAVISGTLLGLGAGSAAVALFPRAFPAGQERPRIALACAVASLATLLALAVALAVPFVMSKRLLALAGDSLHVLGPLLPFAATGAVLALALRAGRARVGVLYAADLAGAALGAIAFIPLAGWVGAPGAVIVAALGFGAASLVLADSRGTRAAGGAVAGLAALGLALHMTTEVARIRWSKAPSISVAGESYWNAYSYVSVFDSGLTSAFGWGFGSADFERPLLEQKGVVIDLNAGTVLTKFEGDLAPLDFLRHDLTTAVYALSDRPSVCIIGTGGGRDVLAALASGARSVRGIEVNDLMHRLLTEHHAAYAGLAALEQVSLVQDEARSYLEREPERFDVIQASLIDTYAASASGAFALTENGLYTVEAFALFLRRLTPDGVLTMSRWRAPREAEVARLVSVALAGLEQLGASDPARSLALLGAGPLATLLVKTQPFTDADLDRLEETSARMGFEPIYLPGRIASGLAAPLALGTRGWWRHVQSSRSVDLRPPSDDRPFFFYLTPPSEWLEPQALLRAPDLAQKLRVDHMDPKHLLVVLVLLAALAALLLLVAPALIVARRAAREARADGAGAALPGSRIRIASLAYMAAVGLAFMFVEIALLTRLSIVLGHPVLSLAVVLGGLLVASGAGSLASERLSRVSVERWVRVLPLLVAALALAMNGLAAQLGGLATPSRVAAAGLLVVLLGFPMGMPLPSGLRYAGSTGPAVTPILFGVNGAFSVLGSVLAMVFLLNGGARFTLLAGALLYLASALLLRRLVPGESEA